jgi:hypothetical protein
MKVGVVIAYIASLVGVVVMADAGLSKAFLVWEAASFGVGWISRYPRSVLLPFLAIPIAVPFGYPDRWTGGDPLLLWSEVLLAAPIQAPIASAGGVSSSASARRAASLMLSRGSSAPADIASRWRTSPAAPWGWIGRGPQRLCAPGGGRAAGDRAFLSLEHIGSGAEARSSETTSGGSFIESLRTKRWCAIATLEVVPPVWTTAPTVPSGTAPTTSRSGGATALACRSDAETIPWASAVLFGAQAEEASWTVSACSRQRTWRPGISQNDPCNERGRRCASAQFIPYVGFRRIRRTEGGSGSGTPRSKAKWLR